MVSWEGFGASIEVVQSKCRYKVAISRYKVAIYWQRGGDRGSVVPSYRDRVSKICAKKTCIFVSDFVIWAPRDLWLAGKNLG